MLRKLVISTIVVAAAFALPVHAEQVVAKLKVDDKWFEGQIRFTQGPPSYKYRWTVKVKDGVVLLCGVGKWMSANLGPQAREVMRDQGFYIDDALYYQDISFFATVKRSTKLVGTTANCVSTGKAPPKQVNEGVGIISMHPKRVYRY